MHSGGKANSFEAYYFVLSVYLCIYLFIYLFVYCVPEGIIGAYKAIVPFDAKNHHWYVKGLINMV